MPKRKPSLLIQNIIRDLSSNSTLRVWEAAKAAARGPANKTLANVLLKQLRKGKRPTDRCAAAHALGFGRYKGVIPALERCLANRKENVRVRGYAAEALANQWANRSIPILTKCLRDPSKIVRFWCVYALGVANTLNRKKARVAIPALRELVEGDKRVVRGCWSVQDEAQWALANLENRIEDAEKIERRLTGSVLRQA
jgi:HEAT repeat protein